MRNLLVLMMWTAGGRPTLSPCRTNHQFTRGAVWQLLGREPGL